jgi:propionyl-CoA synthetase
VILQREQEVAKLEEGRDVDWHAFQYGVEPADCVPVEGNHPAYILYTSGTTGQPKGVVRATAGHLVALNWSMRNVYGVEPGRRVLGRLRRGLGRGAQLHLLRAPDPRQHDRGVRGQARGHARRRHLLARDRGLGGEGALHRAHRLPRDQAGRSEGRAAGDYDISSLEALYLAGERADPDTIRWAEEKLKVPVIDHWWQTETGWPSPRTRAGSSSCR